jgi:hypothetical protein
MQYFSKSNLFSAPHARIKQAAVPNLCNHHCKQYVLPATINVLKITLQSKPLVSDCGFAVPEHILASSDTLRSSMHGTAGSVCVFFFQHLIAAVVDCVYSL